MIHYWKLKNFKSIKKSMTQLELGDITIFAGANSSGKSTLIQSILMISQTLLNSDISEALLLNGELVSLGTVYDIWNNSNIEDELEIEFIIGDDDIGCLYFHLIFNADHDDKSNTKVILKSAQYSHALANTDEYDEELEITCPENYSHKISFVSDELIEIWNNDLEKHGIEYFDNLNGADIKTRTFLPDEIYYQWKREAVSLINARTAMLRPLQDNMNPQIFDYIIPNRETEILYTAINKDSLPLGILPEYEDNLTLSHQVYVEWTQTLVSRQLNNLMTFLDKKLEKVSEEFDGWYHSVFASLFTKGALQFFTSQIRYISANRVPPTALFGFIPRNPLSEVGIDGHNVAAALVEYSDKEIRYWHPTKKKDKNGTLIEAVETWLQYFQIIEKLAPERSGKLGTLLKLKSEGVEQNLDLTSIGFGASQVLPILVQGLLCDKGMTFIVEQPEVHLHPDLQAKIAYFFYSLTKLGVQCIIETHSEHIVNQFRLVIAKENENSHFNERVRVYFAERDKKKGTIFTEVKINRNGTIERWPNGFMDQSHKLADEILKVAEKRVKNP